MTSGEKSNISMAHQPHKGKSSDNLFDLKRILFLLRKNWYLFLISLPLCIGSVYIYHRYTVPVYQARATLLLKGDDQRSITRSELIEGFGLSPEARSVENQMFVIKSKKLVKKAIDRLDFGVTYMIEGNFKDSELYYSKPFVVEFDSLHPQLLNTPIKVSYISNDEVNVNVESEGGQLFIYNGEKRAGSSGPVKFEQNVKFGEWITNNHFSFRILPSSYSFTNDKVYHFVFNTNDQLANQYRSRLGVSAYREGSSIIYISATGTSHEKLTVFLDALCEVILEYNLEQKNNMATRSLAFINAQLENISDTLDKVQNSLLKYRKDNRFMGPSEFSQRLAEQYFDAEKEVKMLEMQQSYYKFLQDNLDNASDIEEYMLPAVNDENTGFINQLVMQLISYEEEKEILLSAVEKNNQYLRSLESKIEVTKENLQKGINQVLRSLDLEQQKYHNKLKDIVVDMDQLPDLEKTYLKIERTYKLNDAIYTFLLQKQSETQIAKASNVPDNEIIDSASISAIISPTKKSNYQKGFLLALVLPSAFIALKEFLNTKVRNKDDVHYLAPGLSIVGTVVHNKDGVNNVINDYPHSVISESFRAIRTKLKYMNNDHDAKVITLTSTNTGEGKTFCAENLASVFAISGKKTVLLGFDLRKPRLSALFQLIDKPGLSNYLIDEEHVENIIYSTDYKNLYVVPAGPIPPNPSELLSGGGPKELFAYLRKHFDVIVVDSPPIGLVADARMLMQESDFNLFVVRANYTLKEHMSLTIENLMEEDVAKIGILLNDVSLTERGYGYYSAEYYSEHYKA
ncbi:GumC family protein [Carboxylicivirga caseinilyticus]|uniref:GumC family protein n=1 Tax=Carboxylicivirga caseinilyticus TaxID=3417572 RepID=UPI003D33A43D|nr:polysaccharide biosynthesis tyrosine autokinase [Marinilabiliaceae bacterium A049]